MTGAVSWEVLTWVVVLVVVAGGGVAGFLLWLWAIVKALREAWEKDLADLSADHDRDLADRDNTIKDISLRLEGSDARAKMAEAALARELADHRQHVGETFATKEGVTQAVNRVENAIDRLTGRIDQLLANKVS